MDGTQKKAIKIIGGMLVLAALAAVFADIYVFCAGSRGIYETIQDLPPADAVLVLGAAVYRDGRMSAVFADRAAIALEVYNHGSAKKILVSGDHSKNDYDEVNIAKKFFIQNNVPSEDIFVDYAGFNTYDSAKRAKEVFQVNSLIVATQEFHLPRALYLAREAGIEAYGIKADRRRYDLGIYNTLRENGARIKAFWRVVSGAAPRFLGDAIPITGDGRESWDR
jgi:vancomycin permeability regulator SanA